MTPFQVIIFDGGVKPHVVPTEFVQYLTDEMWDRFRVNVSSCLQKVYNSNVAFDLGGAICANDGTVSATIDDVHFTTLLRDVKRLQKQLNELEPRFFNGKKYYKLHSRWHAIVLTSEQRKNLLKAWQAF